MSAPTFSEILAPSAESPPLRDRAWWSVTWLRRLLGMGQTTEQDLLECTRPYQPRPTRRAAKAELQRRKRLSR